LIDETGRCLRHPDEPQPWCLECKATAETAEAMHDLDEWLRVQGLA
jgi:hypothetical protein